MESDPLASSIVRIKKAEDVVRDEYDNMEFCDDSGSISLHWSSHDSDCFDDDDDDESAHAHTRTRQKKGGTNYPEKNNKLEPKDKSETKLTWLRPLR
jgi:hypothetical protein